MAIVLSTPPYSQFYDDNGDPLSGGKIHTYVAGTTTNQATYTDQGGATPSANPIILDSSGRAEFWLDNTLSYRFDIKDSADVLVRTVDTVAPFTPGLTVVQGSITPAFTSTGAVFYYSKQVGQYERIGNGVKYQFRIACNSAPTGTTTNAISVNLPYPIKTQTDMRFGCHVGIWSDINITTGTELAYDGVSGSSALLLNSCGDNVATAQIQAGFLGAAAEIRSTITYIAEDL